MTTKSVFSLDLTAMGLGVLRPYKTTDDGGQNSGVRNQKIINHDLPAEQVLRQAGIHEPHEN